jgi:hypothetical protein
VADRDPLPPPDTVFSVLMPLPEGQTAFQVAHSPVMFSLSDSSYHFLVDTDGSMELYAVKDDPGETRNLAGDPASRPVLARFRNMLAGVLGVGPAGPRRSGR